MRLYGSSPVSIFLAENEKACSPALCMVMAETPRKISVKTELFKGAHHSFQYRQSARMFHGYRVVYSARRNLNRTRVKGSCKPSASSANTSADLNKPKLIDCWMRRHCRGRQPTFAPYVDAVRRTATHVSGSSDAVERWSRWALAEADRIDPVKTGRMRDFMWGNRTVAKIR